jgi:TRAP-type transport system periplasmic protein
VTHRGTLCGLAARSLSCALAVLVMSGWSSRILAAEFELRVGHNGGPDHPYQKGFEEFKRVAEAESKGRITVTIYPSGQLGAEDRVNNMVRSGLVAAQATSVAGGLAPFVPDVDALNYPFLFRDLDHYYRVMDGPVGRRLAEEVQSRLNVVFLGWGFSGVRSAWNRKRPIIEPEDLRNLKLRVIDSRIVNQTFTCFGAEVTPMAFGELYNALEQGVIDGAETDDTDLMVERFFEVTRYVSLTEHLYLGAAFVFSRKIFDSLPVDLQQVVRDAGAAAVSQERLAMAQETAKARIFLQTHGLRFNQVDRVRFAAEASRCYGEIQSPNIAAIVKQIQAQ